MAINELRVELHRVVALDEFQYFHRKVLYEFNSHLQYEVDQLARDAADVAGGLIVLGSVLTEMAALLEDRSAPLFARLTGEPRPIPEVPRWTDLAASQMEGVELEQHYRETLRVLGQQGGTTRPGTSGRLVRPQR